MDVRIPVCADVQRCNRPHLRGQSRCARDCERPQPESAGSQVLLDGERLLTKSQTPSLATSLRAVAALISRPCCRGNCSRPYPEFCDINENQDPAGGSNYNALDVNYTHRVSQGLTLLASYTFSKFLDNVGGPENWANASANFAENIRNVYNLAAEKSVDATDIPHSFVLSYVYEIPVGKGRKFGSGMNGVLNAIDWRLANLWYTDVQRGISSEDCGQVITTISAWARM